MGKRKALRDLKRIRRVEVLERSVFIQEVRDSSPREQNKALKRRKLVARP